MRIAVACDHGGYELKCPIVAQLREMGHDVHDLGAHRLDPQDDYPDYARYVGQAIQHKQVDRGILICGSGVGACVVANKFHGIRAALCHDTYSARQGVEHDDANVLCLGARIVGPALAAELVKAFVSATFSGEERHVRRLAKLRAVEQAHSG